MRTAVGVDRPTVLQRVIAYELQFTDGIFDKKPHLVMRLCGAGLDGSFDPGASLFFVQRTVPPARFVSGIQTNSSTRADATASSVNAWPTIASRKL